MRISCINENQPASYDNGLIMMQMILPRTTTPRTPAPSPTHPTGYA